MWEIRKHTLSGNQGAHTISTTQSKDAAINYVLCQLPWQEDASGQPLLRHVMQDGEPCYEDQVACDLDGGFFTFSHGSSTVTYRLEELTAHD